MIYQRAALRRFVGWPAEKPPDARPRQTSQGRGEALFPARRVHLDRQQEQDKSRGERGRGGDVDRLSGDASLAFSVASDEYTRRNVGRRMIVVGILGGSPLTGGPRAPLDRPQG